METISPDNNKTLDRRIKKALWISLSIFFINLLPPAFADDYEFDPDLLLGSSNSINIKQLSDGNYIEPGDYEVDIYINNRFFKRKMVTFQLDDKHKVIPCFTKQQIDEMGILLDNQIKDNDQSCFALKQLSSDITDTFDASNFRITIAVPQILLKKTP